jgi:hypothetical protein
MGTKAWAAGVGAAALLAAAAPVAAADPRALLEKIDSDHFGLAERAGARHAARLWATSRARRRRGGARLPAARRRRQGDQPPIAGRDWCLGALQGAIMIRARDGTKRTYTYEAEAGTAAVDCAGYLKHPARWAQTAGRSRFGVSKGPFGDGAAGFQIVPYRTVAVGRHLVPLGTVLMNSPRAACRSRCCPRKAVHDG